jgi:alkanesulfonate monooxygenase SsuD/methylene tetrahydromethanopterin reductase-like flavin-dependent oxidoreductase (luciferase family)
MRLALSLSCQHPVGSDMKRHLDDHLEQARVAAELGFAGLFYFEHYLMPQFTMLHQPTFLARVAAEAGEMQVGTGISLVALHNPVELADAAATLDVITGGRFIFGVGLGYRQAEFDAFGVDKTRAAAVFERRLDLIKRLWTGDRVDAEADGLRLRGVTCTLRPIQRPHPPIWIAANSDAAVRRAARLGDAWFINPHSQIGVIERQLAGYREALAAAGKPSPGVLPLAREIFIAERADRARELARPHLEAKYRTYVDWGQDRVLPAGDALALPYEELVRDRFLIGDPGDVLHGLLDCEERLGANYVVARVQWAGMDPADALRAIRLLGREVIPELRRRERGGGAAAPAAS